MNVGGVAWYRGPRRRLPLQGSSDRIPVFPFFFLLRQSSTRASQCTLWTRSNLQRRKGKKSSTYTQMHEAWSVLLWQVFYLREDNLIWIGKRMLLWNLLRKLLHYLQKITLQIYLWRVATLKKKKKTSWMSCNIKSWVN